MLDVLLRHNLLPRCAAGTAIFSMPDALLAQPSFPCSMRFWRSHHLLACAAGHFSARFAADAIISLLDVLLAQPSCPYSMCC